MMNSGGIPGMAAGLAGKGNMIGATGMGMNLFGNPSSLGMRGTISLCPIEMETPRYVMIFCLAL